MISLILRGVASEQISDDTQVIAQDLILTPAYASHGYRGLMHTRICHVGEPPQGMQAIDKAAMNSRRIVGLAPWTNNARHRSFVHGCATRSRSHCSSGGGITASRRSVLLGRGVRAEVDREQILHLGDARRVARRALRVSELGVGTDRSAKNCLVSGNLDGDAIGVELGAA